MTDSPQHAAEQDAPLVLQPLPDAVNLLDGEAGGLCSNGVCHFPAPKTR